MPLRVILLFLRYSLNQKITACSTSSYVANFIFFRSGTIKFFSCKSNIFSFRNIRSRDINIEKRSYQTKRKLYEIEDEILNEQFNEELMKGHIAVMKNRLPNTDDNKNQILNLMKQTCLYRKSWIQNDRPFHGDIIKVRPRFIQMPFLVILNNFIICLINYNLKFNLD